MNPLHVMAKPRGAVCNLDCTYCYFLSKERLYPGSSSRMDDDTLQRFVREQLRISAAQGQEPAFTWQGGEPTLMGLDFFRRAVALQRAQAGGPVANVLQTNGTLLDDAWCAFLREEGFLVGVSIDGPRALHDASRVDKGGLPTFDRVMRGVDALRRHGVDFNVLTTVNAANAGHPLDVYRFLRDEVGSPFLQFIPIVERDNETGFQEGERVTARSVTGEVYGKFLITIFDEWVRRDVGTVFVQLFDVALGVWYGDPASLCIFAETCGTAMAMEHTGDVYSCDHYVEPKYLLGNIRERTVSEMANSPLQRAFGQHKRDSLPRKCRRCPVRFACNGGCPKDRILHTPDGEPGLNWLCDGYLAFFQHIDEPMRRMAALLRAERSPAEIMGAPR